MNYIFTYYLDGTQVATHNKTYDTNFFNISFNLSNEKTLNVLQNGTVTVVDSYTYSTEIREPRYEMNFTSDTTTYNIYAISKSSITLTKGTYVWKLEPTLPEDGTSTTIDMRFKTEIGTSCIQMVLSLDKVQYSKKQVSGVYQLKTAYDYISNSWSTGDRTIIVEEDVTLTSAQYALLVTNGNLTKKTFTYTINWYLDSNLVNTTSFTYDYQLKESDVSLYYSTIITNLCSLDKGGKTLSACIYDSDIVTDGGDFYLDIVNNTFVIHNYSTNLYLIYGASLKKMANAIRKVNGKTDTYTPSQMISEITKMQSPSGTINITTTAKTDVSSYEYAQIQDNNLLASNIKAGVTILGINGAYTSDATATASDIKSGKTAYINGAKVTGTHTEFAPSGNATTSQVLKGATFYSDSTTKLTGTMETYSGSITITANTTLNTAGKYLPSNITINVPTLDTSDGTITANDVLQGKIGYSKGARVVGAIKTYNGEVR